MFRGAFYASNGVHLTTCDMDDERYRVEVDVERTKSQLEELPAWAGIKVPDGPIGYRIDFIGEFGDVLKSVSGMKATFRLDEDQNYVRARVSYTRVTPDRRYESFFAWGQPVFLKIEGTTH